MKSHPLLFLLTPLISATSSIIFINNCPYNMYTWVSGAGLDQKDGFHTVVPGHGGTVIHNMVNTERHGAGISIKIRDVPYFAVQPAGILQAEYHFTPATNSIWYDFSAIDCDRDVGPENPRFCPFLAGGVRMRVPGADPGLCPLAQCMGPWNCVGTYLEHGFWDGEPSYRCDVGCDVHFETCVWNLGPQTNVDGKGWPNSP